MRYVSSLLSAAAGVALVVGLSPPANATLQIAIQVGATTVTCQDNAACDTNPLVGTLSIADQNIGGVQLTGSSQQSQGTLLNPNSLDILNTSSLQVSNLTGATVHIEAAVSDINFVGPITSFNTSASGTWQNAVGSTITTDFFDSPANVQGATAPNDTPGTKIDTFSNTALLIADSFSHSAVGPIIDGALFGMTEHFVADLTAGSVLVNRGQTEIKVPVGADEPGTLAILGGSLLFGGIAIRRRRKQLDNTTPYAIA
jgi:hypothetical protein